MLLAQGNIKEDGHLQISRPAPPPLTRARRLLPLLALAPFAACAPAPETALPPPPAALPAMAWDGQAAQDDQWTEATLDALEGEGAVLLSSVPHDIETWCPGYVQADPRERAAFWSGLLSALARFESTWNPHAVGGGGQWFGLVQIAPATARAYGCDATTGQALTDGAENLECAVRIAARTVLRDGVVAAGGGGFAADWGPFASASKRAEMADWVSGQEYCQRSAAPAPGDEA